MTSKWMIHRTLQKAYEDAKHDLRLIDEDWGGVYGDLSCVDYQSQWGKIDMLHSLAEKFGIELIKTDENGEQVQ